ncbi:uncharacterized protein BX664DRAFT_65432 [Halteromyces radiatus]|uniref:uncharacterized protein n=1 Tax=Halteromyces radiatus TaxID=101107 RepID=UPI00221FC295|nr:uncharacterized protein BX664DRAFT_65432 [Halteromyces radiatus]KAI8096742.1 hypothetical protein BX664DRAFT_65432 [Halteromyces radiatus]
MANTPTDSQQQKQQTQPITYSPPNHSIEDIDKPPIVLVPTLTPPHVVAHQHSPSYSHSTTATPSSLNDPANQQTTSTNSVTSTTHFTMTTTDVMKQHLPPRKRIQSLKKQFTKPNLSAPVIPSSQSIISEPNDTLPTKEAAMVVPSVDQPINEITTTTNSSHNSSRSSSPLVNIEDDSGETTETDDEDYFHQQQQNKKRHKDDTTYDDEDDIGSGQSKQTVIIQPATTITTPSAVSKKPTVTSMQKTKKPLKKHWTKTKNILESSDVLPTDRQDNIHPSSSSLSPWAPDEKLD